MILEVDFNSEEALYIQLRNQIIVGIATKQAQGGRVPPERAGSLQNPLGLTCIQ